jgi:hypothetical protein
VINPTNPPIARKMTNVISIVLRREFNFPPAEVLIVVVDFSGVRPENRQPLNQSNNFLVLPGHSNKFTSFDDLSNKNASGFSGISRDDLGFGGKRVRADGPAKQSIQLNIEPES